MGLSTKQKMTLARAVQRPVLAARRSRRAGPQGVFRRRGVRWELDLREGIDFSIWFRGCFEPSTVAAYERLLRPGASVVDVGANIGAHTLHLARVAGPAGAVHAIEPTAEAFGRLRRNLALNPELAGRVTCTQAMLLASRHAALPAAVVSSWPLLPRRELDATHPGRSQPTEGACVTTLDQSLEDFGVDRVDLVKLDVDGFECDVLAGGARTLDERRPVVLTELAPSVAELHGHSGVELVERFRAHRYRLWDLRGRTQISEAVIERLLRQRASLNVVALADP